MASAFLSFFAKKTGQIAKTIPILKQIAATFKAVYDVYQKTTENKEAAKFAVERCEHIATIIVECIDNGKNNTLTESQVQIINFLYGQVEEMQSLVKAYCLKNIAMKVISNHGFKESYDKINRRIDEYIQMVLLTMQVAVYQQTGQNQDMLRKNLNKNDQIYQQTGQNQEMLRETVKKNDQLVQQTGQNQEMLRKNMEKNAHMLQQTNEIFKILTNADQKQKLDANNQQKLNEWILYSGTIHSSTIEVLDIISDEGANGVVHKGIKDGHMAVAVKKFNISHPKLFHSVKDQALRETFIGMSFQHPNIVRTLGCVYDQKPSAHVPTGNIMIIMEHMKNGSLHQFIKRSDIALTKADRHAFIYDAANGIYEMHLKNKCHHDIKPGNMLIDDRYNVKICDLDSVKDLTAATSKTTKSTVGTHTKQYAAPEYLKGGIAYNVKCDIFSFAMSMYEVATGETPFKGMNPDQIANALMSKDARPIIPLNMYDLVDDKYVQLMRKSWSTDPDKRPSMKEIVTELQNICNKFGPSKWQVPPAPSSTNNNNNKEAEEKMMKLREENKRIKREKERIKREKEDAIAKRDRKHQAEIDQLKHENEKRLKDADANRARRQHEEEVKEAQERAEKERKKALRLKEMKNMPVIKRTENLLSEIDKLSNLSEAKSRWDQHEEIDNNLRSLKHNLEKAKAEMDSNIHKDNERRESRKIKLNEDLNDAKAQLQKAKANVSKIKSIRNEMKEINEKLKMLDVKTRNFKAEVENLQQEVEMKDAKLKEFHAQFNHELELLKQCDYLIGDIDKEIQKAGMLEDDEYDEERLDELAKCRDNVVNGKNKLLIRPVVTEPIRKKEEECEREEEERKRKEDERKRRDEERKRREDERKRKEDERKEKIRKEKERKEKEQKEKEQKEIEERRLEAERKAREKKKAEERKRRLEEEQKKKKKEVEGKKRFNKYFPKISTILQLLKDIHKIAETATKSKQICEKVATLCHGLEESITQCANTYKHRGNIYDIQGTKLNLLNDALLEMNKFVSKYATLGFFGHFFNNGNPMNEYNVINNKIDDAMRILQANPVVLKYRKLFDGKTEVHLKGNSLQGNYLTDEDALAIGELLKTNNTLIYLYLRHNNITDVQSIGEGLKTNNTLKTLTLHNNNITDVQSIGEGLKTNNTLSYLHLSNNNITDDGGIQSIIDGLKTNNTLEYLTLYNNQLSDNMKSQLKAIQQYKRDGSNGYQQVKGMEIWT